MLRQRLEARATDSPQKIEERLARANYELSFAPQFDERVVNNELSETCTSAIGIINRFLNE